MSSLSKNPGTVSQVTGGKFQSFSNLGNIKNVTEGSYAVTGTIQGKAGSPNRPSTISCTNFGFGLPTGAEVVSVKVTLRHKKTGSCNIGAPTLTLLGVSGLSKKAFAPTASMTNKSYTFKSTKLTRTVVNGSGFGVKVDYPTNSGSGTGTVSVSYVRINVEYKVPSYSLSLKKVSGGYNEEPYIVEATISNKTLTAYNPTCTLSAPVGFSFTGSTGRGVVTRVNSRTLTWDPKLSGKVGSSTVRFSFDTGVTFPSGVDVYTGTFSLVESLNSTSKTHTATITERPVTEEETEPEQESTEIDENTPPNNIWDMTKGEPYEVYITCPPNIDWSYNNRLAFAVGSEVASWSWKVGETDLTTSGSVVFVHKDLFDDGHCTVTVTPSSVLDKDDAYYLFAGNDSSGDVYFKIRVRPSEADLSAPFFSILEPSEEELNRLGDGYSYTVQTQLKHTTTDSYERDWYRNNRIGICNKQLPTNPTNAQIFDNALYWSNPCTTPNSYNNLEAQFTYNKDYPVYILLTGDYNEATTYDYDTGTVTFTEPCIIETTSYKEPETNGTYPQPINELINLEDSNGLSTVTLEGYTNTNPVRAYNIPVETDFGTNDDLAIRGIQVRANIEQTDKLSINAKLVSPDGETGQRSTILNGDETELIIGGLGDLWGFNTTQLKQLTNWETELSISNLLSNEQSTILISDIEIHIWFENIEKQEITIKVEDENIAAYGAFIEKATIPEGLNTDTSYLTIDGTDTNDVYRQNIREKTITLEFNIDSCDLNTSTTLLRQLTKLLVNEKDQYNRPIPKKLQLSNYPDDIFEYIIEDTLDVENEVTGFNVKAKLVIPAGTSYTKDDIVTNTTGYVQGLAAINPIITLQPSDENIEIVEAITGQTFNIGYGGDWNDKVVVIDCEDRKVYLKTTEEEEDSIDISQYVDYSSDWFRLHGEYEFEGTNCTIRTVKYNERW